MSKRSRLPLHLVLSMMVLSLVAPAALRCQSRIATTDELAKRAEVIAVGKVTRLESEWNETRTMIRTRVTVSVDQYVKGGGSANTLTIYVPGGEVGGIGEVYSDMATFRRDESVVVFAERDKQNRYRVSAGSQGKFTVKRDEITGKVMVSGNRTLDDLTKEVKRAAQLQDGN